MCVPGNQTIFRACMMRLKSMNGGRKPPRSECKRILDSHGGCLTYTIKDAITK
jgi:hypothetical protein